MQVLTFFMQKVVSLRLPSESNVKPQAAKPKVAEEEDDPFSGYESDNESDEEDETPRPRRSPPRSPPNTPRERLGSSDKSSLQNPEETALALANGKIKSKPSLSLMVPIPAEFSYVERIAASENFLAKSIDLDNAVNNAVDKSKERLLLLQLSTLAKMESFIISKDNAFDFELPCGIVTIGVAAMVIDLFKSGGRLSYRSVHKLLRLGYKSLRQLPNTTYISVGVDDKLTVVGDIHGKTRIT